MSYRRVHDLDEARHLCAVLADRCNSRRFRDHILACQRTDDLPSAQRHLVIAFKIARKEGAVTADDWRAWKRDVAQQRRSRNKTLTPAGAARPAETGRYVKSVLGGLATERFRLPPPVTD